MSEIVNLGSDEVGEALRSVKVPISQVRKEDSANFAFQAAKDGNLYAVIVDQTTPPPLMEWAVRSLTNTARVIVMLDAVRPDLDLSSCSTLKLPAPLGELTRLLGYSFEIGGESMEIAPNGRVTIAGSPDYPEPPPSQGLSAPPLGGAIQPSSELVISSRQRPEVVSRSQVLLSIAGKGGVGKSLVGSIQSALMASRKFGLRVLLIDGNAGQGDARRYFQLQTSKLDQIPNISNYNLSTHDWSSITVKAKTLTEISELGVDFTFDAVFAPPHRDQSTVSITYPAAAYLDLIRSIQSDPVNTYDLIVVDTQIVETNYVNPMRTDFISPLLREGAKAVVLFGEDSQTFNNARQAIIKLIEESQCGTDQFGLVGNQLTKQLSETSYNGIRLLGQIPGRPGIGTIINQLGDASGDVYLDQAVTSIVGWAMNMQVDTGNSSTPTKRKLSLFKRTR